VNENFNLFALIQGLDSVDTAVFEEAAKANEAAGVFANVKLTSESRMSMITLFGFEPEDLPAFVALTPENMNIYISDVKPADQTVTTINKFVSDVTSGAMKPKLLSAPVPSSNDGVVKEVVAT